MLFWDATRVDRLTISVTWLEAGASTPFSIHNEFPPCRQRRLWSHSLMTSRDAPDDELPLSILTCLSDSEVFRANLIASPCLSPGTIHEVIAVANCPSAAGGLNIGLERAKHGWVLCVHQDVFLPA